MISPRMSQLIEDLDLKKEFLKVHEFLAPVEKNLIERITSIINKTAEKYSISIIPIIPIDGNVELLLTMDISNPHLCDVNQNY